MKNEQSLNALVRLMSVGVWHSTAWKVHCTAATAELQDRLLKDAFAWQEAASLAVGVHVLFCSVLQLHML